MKNYFTVSFFYFFVAISILFLFFLLYINSSSAFFANRFSLKLALIILLCCFTFLASIYFSSFSKAACLIIPISVALYRPFLDLGVLFGLAAKFDQYTIDLFLFYLLIIFFISLFLNKGKVLFVQSLPIKYYKFLLLWGGISLFWAQSVTLGLVQIIIMMVLLVSYKTFKSLFEDDDNVRYFTYGLIILSLIQILITWPEFFGIDLLGKYLGSSGGVTIEEGGVLRAGGTAAKAVLAMILTISMPYIYSFYVFDDQVSKQKKVFVLLFSILMILTIAMSRFRSDLGASLIVFYFLFSRSVNRKIFKINKITAYIFVIVTVAIVYIFLTFGITDPKIILLRSTYVERLLSYYAGLQALINSHFLGIGINNFFVNDTIIAILGPNSWNLTQGKPIHSEYIKALTELGVIGLILFCLFIYNFLKPIYRLSNKREVIGVFYSMLSIAIVALVDVPFNKPGVLIIVGAFIAILYHKETGKGIKVQN